MVLAKLFRYIILLTSTSCAALKRLHQLVADALLARQCLKAQQFCRAGWEQAQVEQKLE